MPGENPMGALGDDAHTRGRRREQERLDAQERAQVERDLVAERERLEQLDQADQARIRGSLEEIKRNVEQLHRRQETAQLRATALGQHADGQCRPDDAHVEAIVYAGDQLARIADHLEQPPQPAPLEVDPAAHLPHEIWTAVQAVLGRALSRIDKLDLNPTAIADQVLTELRQEPSA